MQGGEGVTCGVVDVRRGSLRLEGAGGGLVFIEYRHTPEGSERASTG